MKEHNFKCSPDTQEAALFLLKGSDPVCNIFPEEFKMKLESCQPRDMFVEEGRQGFNSGAVCKGLREKWGWKLEVEVGTGKNYNCVETSSSVVT